MDFFISLADVGHYGQHCGKITITRTGIYKNTLVSTDFVKIIIFDGVLFLRSALSVGLARVCPKMHGDNASYLIALTEVHLGRLEFVLLI